MLTNKFIERYNNEREQARKNQESYREAVTKLVKPGIEVDIKTVNEQLNWITKCLLLQMESEGLFVMGKTRMGDKSTIWFSDREREYNKVRGAENGNNVLIRGYQQKSGYQLEYFRAVRTGYGNGREITIELSSNGKYMAEFLGDKFSDAIKQLQRIIRSNHAKIYERRMQDDENLMFSKEVSITTMRMNRDKIIEQTPVKYFRAYFKTPARSDDGAIWNRFDAYEVNVRGYNQDGSWPDYLGEPYKLMLQGLKRCEKERKSIESHTKKAWKDIESAYNKAGYGRYIAAMSILKNTESKE